LLENRDSAAKIVFGVQPFMEQLPIFWAKVKKVFIYAVNRIGFTHLSTYLPTDSGDNGIRKNL
jgi:hypothetical protein